VRRTAKLDVALAIASIVMTDHSRNPEGSPRCATVVLGLAAVVMAVAIDGATAHPPDAPLPQPSTLSTSPPVQNAPSAAAASGDLRSGDASAPPGPAAESYPRTASDLGAAHEAALDPAAPALDPRLPAPVRDPPPPALDPPPKAGRFVIDLYDEGDFVSQARADWCVPASILAMMNMTDGHVRPTPSQRKLDRLARSLSTPRLRGAGSEPEGWAGSLDRLGVGPYEVRAERTRSAAIASAARALRLTGRPVGLLIWRGAHAWVMSGFRATADPAHTDDFKVTHIYVLDPWYPRVSSIWGPARQPDAIVPVRRLAEDYLAWRRPAVRYPEKDGRFILVVPVADTPAVGPDRSFEPEDRARR
jgi:hypothetical protein